MSDLVHSCFEHLLSEKGEFFFLSLFASPFVILSHISRNTSLGTETHTSPTFNLSSESALSSLYNFIPWVHLYHLHHQNNHQKQYSQILSHPLLTYKEFIDSDQQCNSMIKPGLAENKKAYSFLYLIVLVSNVKTRFYMTVCFLQEKLSRPVYS